MELVERDAPLAELKAAARDARAGRGRLVLITGEAGAGKTALVRQFTSEAATRSKILWGMCDELVTPRPLGPFRDMAGQLGVDLAGDAGAAAALDALGVELDAGLYPTVVVVEDAHWADEATLDGIRFLGRRVGRLPAVLIVTFRDEEIPPDHPLRITVGAVPPDDVRRISLPPLTRDGVARLAGRADADELYRLTGGNPFYVSEVLAAPQAGVPRSVQDAVMARIGRLAEAGRAMAETAAVVPGRAESWLLDELGVFDGVDDAVRAGVVHADGAVVAFRHELARQAVENSLPPGRRRQLNRQVLEALAARNAEPARLAHHAVQAGDPAAVVRHAHVAARRAASLNAHRQSVEHVEQALTYSDQFGDAELAALLDLYANECYLTGRHDKALDTLNRAIELHHTRGDDQRLGASLRLLSDVHWFLGHGSDADDAATRAVAVLENIPAGPALASAYAQRSKLAIIDFRGAEAIMWGDKAIQLARQLDDVPVLAVALITGGVARWLLGSSDDATVVEGLELAKTHRLPDVALAGYLYLANGHTNLMHYPEGRRYIDEGLAFYEDNDVVSGSQMLLANRAWWHFEQGHWVEAEQDARRLMATQPMTRGRALRILGQVQARQGDPAAEATLAQAHQLAEPKQSRHNTLPPAVAQVELAWLRGDRDTAMARATALADLGLSSGDRRWRSEVVFWLYRVGVIDDVPDKVMEPYATQIAGRWQDAASAWAELGRPYEQADALADASEPEPLLEALKILEDLGARPRAAMVRRRLAELGISAVPRGPRATTRASPAGLTSRQTEVLRLLAEDLTYQEIADRLFVSVKTVDHHAAAVRAKLNASTRAEAVAAGHRLGIVEPSSSDDQTR
ncbi:AAA family ATPase [Phytoactinopolyspora mesophila]|uniref:AAA family ATPase n=1 Tax=Phytoactinopolyspora mesophila TaxID=2650750 RepID=UPI0013909548